MGQIEKNRQTMTVRKLQIKGSYMRYYHRKIDRLYFRSCRGTFQPSNIIQLSLFGRSPQLEFDFATKGGEL